MSRTRRSPLPIAAGLALLIAVLAHSAAGARIGPASLETVGHIGGAPRDVAMRDGHAYIATGYALEVWDIRDPARPERVGQLLRSGYLPGGSANDAGMRLRLDGPRAYLADRNMVRIVDVSDPSELRELGLWAATQGTVMDVAPAGAYMYVAAGGYEVPAGVMVVNVANPQAITQEPRTEDGEYARLVLSGNRLLAFGKVSEDRGYQAGLRVYDIPVPGHLIEIGRTKLPQFLPYDVAVQGPYLYAGWNGGLHVYDVSDPLFIHEAAEFPTADQTDPVDSVEVAGARALISHRGQVEALDVADPTRPRGLGIVRVNDIPWVAGTAGLAMEGDTAVTTDVGTGIAVVDTSDPGNMGVLARFGDELPGWSHAVAAANGMAYVSDGERVRVVDASDPTAPRVVGSYVPGPTPRARLIQGLAVRGNRVYLSVETFDRNRHEIEVLDLADPTAPRRLARLDLGEGDGGDLLVRGDVAYVASYLQDAAGIARRRLFVVDVGVPDSPRLMGRAELEQVTGGCCGQPELALSGSNALLRTNRGLAVIDVADPGRPLLVGQYEDREVDGVVAVGALAYLASSHGSDASLDTVDVADAAAPRRTVWVTIDWPAVSLGLSTAHLFTGSVAGVRMYRFEPYLRPNHTASRPLPAEVAALALRNGYAYVADSDAGLFILYTGDPDLPDVVPPTATAPPPATPTAVRTATPTPRPPTATPSPRPTTTGPTPTVGPQGRVCPQILNRVPRPVLDAALANPERVGGWNQLQNPSLPPGPFNARRVWLTIRTMGLPFDLLFNPVLYRASCP